MTKTATNAGQLVAVAYVTKWATTRGIVVVRQAETHTSASGVVYLCHGAGLIEPKAWTTDKAEAEKRWDAAMWKAHNAAKAKADRLAKQVFQGPKYEGTP